MPTLSFSEIADLVWGDPIALPVIDGEPDWKVAAWAPEHDPDKPLPDGCVLALRTDSFHRFSNRFVFGSGVRIVTWPAPNGWKAKRAFGPMGLGLVAETIVTNALNTRRPIPEWVPPAAANDNEPVAYRGIVSSAELVSGFVPPDYHIDGIAQKGFIYSLTAASGTGKTALLLLLSALTALGRPLGDREVRKGRVVYFAGENPDDVTMRWIAAAHHLPFDVSDIDVHFIKGTFSIPQMIERIRDDLELLGGADLVVIDTSAAYFQGQDENANTELGKHARELRALTTLPGHPCVMVACHPTKNAKTENLLPRGGGAFIAEVDGNLVCMKSEDGTVRLHWEGKHRGPDFEPIVFSLKTVTAPSLLDSRGRSIPTVLAQPLSRGEVRAQADTARRDEDEVLMELDRDPNQSLNAIADHLGWIKDGAPHKDRARHATDKLKRTKLVTYTGRKWKVTPDGLDALSDIRSQRRSEQKIDASVASLVAKSAVRNA